MTTVLCLASYFKGLRLLPAYRDLGCRTVVVAGADLRDKPWADHPVDELHFVHDINDVPSLIRGVSYLARDRAIDLVVPMEEYMVDVAATVRAHLGCPGMTETTARWVRDKYAMRRRAAECGIPVPDFELVLNFERLDAFTRRVAPPWVVKPRGEGGAVQIHKVHDAERLWEVVHDLGDEQSRHLVEAYIPGDVCHVDSILHDGRVVVATANRYGKPPFDVWQGGGVFLSRTVPHHDPLRDELLDLNRRVVEAMGLQRGAAHVEFIHCRETNRLYFLEIGARVCGANLDQLTRASIGVDLFYEAVRSELAMFRGEPYHLVPDRELEAGLLVCLTRDERPDLSFCQVPELAWSWNDDYHAGVVVASPSSERVDVLLHSIGERLAEEHLAVMPPARKPA